MHLTQEQQYITSKMSECSIALFIFTPTQIDLPPVERQSLTVPGSFGVILRQRIPLLFIPGYFFLQRIAISSLLSAPDSAGQPDGCLAAAYSVFSDERSRLAAG